MKQVYHFSAIVNYKGDTYFVDSCEKMDAGYEMRVFRMNKNYPDAVKKAYNVDFDKDAFCFLTDEMAQYVDGTDLMEAHYATVEEAETDFDNIVDDFLYAMVRFYDYKQPIPTPSPTLHETVQGLKDEADALLAMSQELFLKAEKLSKAITELNSCLNRQV